ncbi:hypothetical protein GCM10027075_58830 [Streptomyces heilongjiangensis]
MRRGFPRQRSGSASAPLPTAPRTPPGPGRRGVSGVGPTSGPVPRGDDSVTAILEHLEGVREEVLAWEKRARATAFDA